MGIENAAGKPLVVNATVVHKTTFQTIPELSKLFGILSELFGFVFSLS